MTIQAPVGITPQVVRTSAQAGTIDVPITGVVFRLPDRDATFQVLVMDFTGPGMTYDIETGVKGAIGGAAEPKDVWVKTVAFPGGEARDFGLRTHGRIFRERLIAVGGRVYQMQSITEVGASNPLPGTDHFLGGLTPLP